MRPLLHACLLNGREGDPHFISKRCSKSMPSSSTVVPMQAPPRMCAVVAHHRGARRAGDELRAAQGRRGAVPSDGKRGEPGWRLRRHQ